LNDIEVIRVAATHNGELAILSPCLTAGDGCINKAHPFVSSDLEQFSCNLRGSSGVVDEDVAFGHAGKRTVFAQYNTAQVIIVPDAAEHDLCAFSCSARSGG